MAESLKRYGWSEDVGSKPVWEWIDPDLILLDETYQRSTSISRARSIASEFQWSKFSAPTVARRNGKVYVIDGGHRVLAAKLRPDIGLIPCLVFFNLGVEGEAENFVGINVKRKTLTGLDKWKAQIVAKDLDALGADATAKSYGYIVGPNGIRATQTVLRLFKSKLLPDVLDCVRSCWPEEKDGNLTGPLLDGMGRFVALYSRAEKKILWKSVANKFKGTSVERISDKARRYVELDRVSYSVGYARAILDIYNHGTREPFRLDYVR